MATVLKGNESLMQIMAKMSQGDMDAMRGIDGLIKLGDMGTMAVLMLDTLEIRGKDLGVLYKEICRGDARTMDSVIGAWQQGGLGGATEEALKAAIANCRRCEPHGLDVGKIVEVYQTETAA